MVDALGKNDSLTRLHLSSRELGPAAVVSLADVLSDGTESADAFVEEAFEEARKRER